METTSRKSGWVCLVMVVVLFLFTYASVCESLDLRKKLLDNFKMVEPSESLLPPGIKIQPGFIEGEGAPIGSIQKPQGNAYVIHEGQTVAYKLKKGFPLFTGDILITLKRSRVNALMNDKSVLALAPYSKLVIDKSVYNPEKRTRSSLMNVLFGRVRFIVTKAIGRSTFNVKTKTAVCGVRGSDFAVSVAPANTETSAVQHFLSNFSLVKEAHAFIPGALITTVVTGTHTSVSFSGLIGATQIIGANAVCAAAAGAVASAPMFVGAAAAAGALGSVGPGLASLSMPPEFE